MKNLSRNLAALAAGVWLASLPLGAEGPAVFKSPREAVVALQKATTANDAAWLKLFGDESQKLMDPTPEGRKEARRLLGLLLKERWSLSSLPENHQLLRLGKEGWPFPVPLKKSAQGWSFDAVSGAEEILNRRIGRNELAVIETCTRLVKAEDLYHAGDRDGDKVREYTSLMLSATGQKDGLYWAAAKGQKPSPLQHALHESWKFAEGRTKGAPWFGYHCRFLPAQGEAAAGGARPYVVNGQQVGGWALVAYPAQYGSTGVMTFLCNQDGTIFEKDLGPDSRQQAEAMTEFNPGEGWIEVHHADLPR